MPAIKAYLYCAKAGEKLMRYSKELFEKKLDDTDEETYEMCCNELGLDPNKHYHVGKGFGEKNRLLVSGDEGYYMPFDKPLNGTVCFECDIEKVEKIENTLLHMAPTFMHETKTLCDSELLRRACLTPEEADEYMPKHALYLENVKEIKPFKIPSLELMKDNVSTSRISVKSLSRAPQNMCWAWAWNDEERKWEHVLILSLRPKNLCNIANWLKDIETRRQVVNEIKEMEE